MGLGGENTLAGVENTSVGGEDVKVVVANFLDEQ